MENEKRREEYTLLVKLFNGCPLQIHSTAAWTHPSTKDQHLLLGAEEGIFILNRNDQEATLEMIFPGRTTWLYCINNLLMSLSGLSRVSLSLWDGGGAGVQGGWVCMDEHRPSLHLHWA